jgi:hypothetical protein
MARRSRFTPLACGLILLVPFARVAAQQAPLREPPALQLRLEKSQKYGGSVAVATGTTGSEPVRFLVDGLGAYQPVSVVAATGSPSAPVRVALAKTNWKEELRSATTEQDGGATLQLRTQGELRIAVTSPNGGAVPFVLAVWAGEDLKPPVESFLVPVKEYPRGPAAAGNRIGVFHNGAMLVVFIVGLVAVLGAGVFLGRRMKGGKQA